MIRLIIASQSSVGSDKGKDFVFSKAIQIQQLKIDNAVNDFKKMKYSPYE